MSATSAQLAQFGHGLDLRGRKRAVKFLEQLSRPPERFLRVGGKMVAAFRKFDLREVIAKVKADRIVGGSRKVRNTMMTFTVHGCKHVGG